MEFLRAVPLLIVAVAYGVNGECGLDGIECRDTLGCCGDLTCQNGTCHPENSTGEALMTKDQLLQTIQTAGYRYRFSTRPPQFDQHYDILMNRVGSAGNITTKRELAMFVANVLHESAGLKAAEEYGPPYFSFVKDPDHPERSYHGRGYLMLRDYDSYKAASNGLYGDDRLVLNPDLVANQTVAWETALWFWAAKVHGQPGIAEGKFGVATDVITGGRECAGKEKYARGGQRYNIYKIALRILDPTDVPDESGCLDKD